MILQLKLASVDYTGGVGAEWEFIVTIDGDEETRKIIGTRLKKGDNPKNRTLLKKHTDDQSSKTILINVQAKELDKYPDKGMGEMKKTIDLKKAGPQPIDVKLEVTEYKGPKVKSNKTGELTLHFIATVTGDEDCVVTNVVPDVDNARNLERFGKNQEGLTTIIQGNCQIFGCVYLENDQWKIHVTDASALISWNVNCNRFMDVYLPGESDTSLCPDATLIDCDNAKKVIDNLDEYIAFKKAKLNQENPPDLPNIFRNASIIAAHEKKHIEDLTNSTKEAFEKIKADLDAVILESDEREQAEFEKDDTLKQAADAWRADSLDQANHNETTFNQISIAKAEEYKTKVMAFRTDKCGKK